MPLGIDNQLFNCAVAIQKGRILGVVPKTYVPNYSEFTSKGGFFRQKRSEGYNYALRAGSTLRDDLLFEDEKGEMCFGIEICEICGCLFLQALFRRWPERWLFLIFLQQWNCRQIWVQKGTGKAAVGKVYSRLCLHIFGRGWIDHGCCFRRSRNDLRKRKSALRIRKIFDWRAANFSEIDIQKLMNDRRKNTSFMELWRDNVREFRKVKFEIEEFEAENITRYVPPHPFVPSDGSSRDRRCSEIFAIQTSALAKRIRHTGWNGLL